jgi:hypothetical protein
MPISLTYIAYSLYYGLFAILAFKLFSWLKSYLNNVRIINKINGPRIVPFIGNAHNIKQKYG